MIYKSLMADSEQRTLLCVLDTEAQALLDNLDVLFGEESLAELQASLGLRLAKPNRILDYTTHLVTELGFKAVQNACYQEASGLSLIDAAVLQDPDQVTASCVPRLTVRTEATSNREVINVVSDLL